MLALKIANFQNKDYLINFISTFLTIVSAVFLIIFVVDKDTTLMAFGLSNTVIIAIATASLIMALLQCYHSRLSVDGNMNDSEVMNLSKVHQAVNKVSFETDRRGASVLLEAASIKLLNVGEINAKLDDLHQHIDKCASDYDVSGTHLLLNVFLQRFEHALADWIINISSWVIRLGSVSLDYMEDGESEYQHFRSMWLEDIELMPTVRRRVIFSLTRLTESFEIVCKFGVLKKPCSILRKWLKHLLR